MIALLLGCLRGVARVEPVQFAVADDPDRPVTGETLVAATRGGAIEELRRRGRTEDAASIAAWPPDVALGVWSTLRPWSRNAEVDLLVTSAGGSRPVTVIRARRVLDVDWGPVQPPPAPALDAQVIAQQYGLGAIRSADASWTDAELWAVDQALAALVPAERAALAGTRWLRRAQSPRTRRELAYFDPTREPPVIEIYDAAFDVGAGAVGPISAMRPASVMTLVHEIGHVIADWPERQAWLAGRTPARGGGPVIDAWRDVRDGPGPTSYGARDPHESFAEAFALHRLDPASLARVMPDAARWFASGAHLEAAGLQPAGLEPGGG